MMRLVGVVGLGVLALAARAQSKAALKIGDLVPDFALPSTTGKEIRLSDFHGRSVVILAFFPAAFTSGCTKEMKGYQASLEKVAGVGAQVLGISTDNLPSLQRWAQELDLEFPLLSDFKRQVSAAYGVLNETRGTAIRTTFVIDKEGRIQHIIQGSEAIDPSGAIAACSRLSQGK